MMSTARFRPLLGRLIRNGATSSVVETLIVSVLMLVTFRVVIRESSLTTFGIWALVQSLTSVVRMADVGVASTLSKYVGQLHPNERQARVWPYVDTGILFNIGFFAVLGAIAYLPLIWAIRGSLPPDQAARAIGVLPLVLVNLILSSLGGVTIATLVGLRQGSAKSLINTGSAIVLLLLTMLLLPRLDLLGLVLAQMVQQAIGLVAGWVTLTRLLERRWLRLRLRFRLAVLRETISLSALVQINVVIAQCWDIILKLALTTWGGAASAGLYELVSRFTTAGRSLLIGPMMLGVPAIARGFATGRLRAVRRIYERQVLLSAAAGIAVYVAIAVAAPVASLITLGRIDRGFFVYLGIMWLVTLVNTLCTPGLMLGPASGRLRGNLIGNVVLVTGTAAFANLAGYLAGSTAALAAAGAMVAVASMLTVALNARRFAVPALPSAGTVRRVLRPGGLRVLLAPIIG